MIQVVLLVSCVFFTYIPNFKPIYNPSKMLSFRITSYRHLRIVLTTKMKGLLSLFLSAHVKMYKWDLKRDTTKLFAFLFILNAI